MGSVAGSEGEIMNHKARFWLAILFAALPPIGFWLGGYDYDKRGVAAVTCFIATILFAALGYTCPAFDKH